MNKNDHHQIGPGASDGDEPRQRRAAAKVTRGDFVDVSELERELSGFSFDQATASESRELPITPFLEGIVRSVQQADVTIVSADRGAGKSLQVTQALARAGFVSY